MPLPLAQVDDGLHAVDFVGREYLGQMVAQLRRLEELGRVVLHPSVEGHETVEGADAADDAAL